MLNAIHRVPALEHAKSRNCSTVRKVSRWMDRSCGESAETKVFLGCGMNSLEWHRQRSRMALAHYIIHGRTPMDLPEADPKRFPDEMCSSRSSAKGSRKFLKALRNHLSRSSVENFTGFGESPRLPMETTSCPFRSILWLGASLYFGLMVNRN